MLADVVAACVPIGPTRVVTPDDEAAEAAADAGAEVVADPGDGQGAAVQAGLDGVEPGGSLVVNADLPCVVPQDLRALLAATPAGALGLVEALDGTTNALSLPSPDAFAPLYGPGSCGPLPRARRVAPPRGRLRRRAEPRRRRGHDGGPRAARLRAGACTRACLAELEGSLV